MKKAKKQQDSFFYHYCRSRLVLLRCIVLFSFWQTLCIKIFQQRLLQCMDIDDEGQGFQMFLPDKLFPLTHCKSLDLDHLGVERKTETCLNLFLPYRILSDCTCHCRRRLKKHEINAIIIDTGKIKQMKIAYKVNISKQIRWIVLHLLYISIRRILLMNLNLQ